MEAAAMAAPWLSRTVPETETPFSQKTAGTARQRKNKRRKNPARSVGVRLGIFAHFLACRFAFQGEEEGN
jgi:hypothetical protein